MTPELINSCCGSVSAFIRACVTHMLAHPGIYTLVGSPCLTPNRNPTHIYWINRQMRILNTGRWYFNMIGQSFLFSSWMVLPHKVIVLQQFVRKKFFFNLLEKKDLWKWILTHTVLWFKKANKQICQLLMKKLKLLWVQILYSKLIQGKRIVKNSVEYKNESGIIT